MGYIENLSLSYIGSSPWGLQEEIQPTAPGLPLPPCRHGHGPDFPRVSLAGGHTHKVLIAHFFPGSARPYCCRCCASRGKHVFGPHTSGFG